MIPRNHGMMNDNVVIEKTHTKNEDIFAYGITFKCFDIKFKYYAMMNVKRYLL